MTPNDNDGLKPISSMSDAYSKRFTQPNAPPSAEGTEEFHISDLRTKHCTVYHGIAIEFDLSPLENGLFSIINSYSNPKPPKQPAWSYHSNKSYGLMLNRGESAIMDAIKKLEMLDLIKRDSQKSRFGTIKWQTAPKANDSLRHIKKKIEEEKAWKKQTGNSGV